MDEKKEVVFSIDPKPWNDYWAANRDALLAHGFPPPENDMMPTLPDQAFNPRCAEFSLPSTEEITIEVNAGKGKKPKPRIQIAWSKAACQSLFDEMNAKRAVLEEGIKFTNAGNQKKFVAGKPEYVFDVRNETILRNLGTMRGVQIDIRPKETGKKAVMALLAKQELWAMMRRLPPSAKGENFLNVFKKMVLTTGLCWRGIVNNVRHPLWKRSTPFLLLGHPPGLRQPSIPEQRGCGCSRGVPVFLGILSRCSCRSTSNPGLADGFGEPNAAVPKGKGSPFFPDTIKSYNIGSAWVEEEYPFYPLDYVLAVEGAFSLRGSVARAIGANSRRFAAFPFVFDSGEDMVNEEAR